MKHVVIVGGGFAGLKAAKILGKAGKHIRVTLIDKANHHLFQPLLYQVATAGLAQSDIAVPIRSILSHYSNISVIQATAEDVDLAGKTLKTDFGDITYDYLILACGMIHSYFGNEEWEQHAPGLKTLEQAAEIRRRVLSAYEEAERQKDEALRRKNQTFVVVGSGPTGVELAGTLGEMSRYTLSRDFRNIDPKLTRIILLEAGHRILPAFSEKQSSKATRYLEKLGVQVWTSSRVTGIDDCGVDVGPERIEAATVLWAAGIKGRSLNRRLGIKLDPQGRIPVEEDLSIKGHSEVFVAGDQASFTHQTGTPLPCLSPVAIQQGRNIAGNILKDIKEKPRKPFRYLDKGTMATVGRSKAIADFGFMSFEGHFAWLLWLFVHIYFITGFNNRLFVFLKWCISYFSNKKNARIIINRNWEFFGKNENG